MGRILWAKSSGIAGSLTRWLTDLSSSTGVWRSLRIAFRFSLSIDTIATCTQLCSGEIERLLLLRLFLLLFLLLLLLSLAFCLLCHSCGTRVCFMALWQLLIAVALLQCGNVYRYLMRFTTLFTGQLLSTAEN